MEVGYKWLLLLGMIAIFGFVKRRPGVSVSLCFIIIKILDELYTSYLCVAVGGLLIVQFPIYT